MPLLLKVALDCDKKSNQRSLFLSSGGHAGAAESMHGVEFPSAIHLCAARLGPRVTERAIKLEITKTRAEQYVTDFVDNSDFADEPELDEDILSFLALISLRARYLTDLVAEKVGLAMRHPQEDMDRLLKEAMKQSYKIDSGSETSWY